MATSRIKYNPGILGDEEIVRSFVVRMKSLEILLEVLRENSASSGTNRHVLVAGARGMGKTMLVRRVGAEVRRNPEYAAHWYPIVFGEESYPVTTPGEFWLEALFHLGEQTGDRTWSDSATELRGELEDSRLRERALGQLLDFADREGKRLLLIVENLNMLLGDQIGDGAAWELRHTLMSEPRLMLLGTAVNRFEIVEHVGRAFFEMFADHELKPLKPAECAELWRALTGEAIAPRRLPVVRILTGGNPRLIAVLAGFAANRSFRELMEQLVHLIDEHTEYFKGHLDALAPQERKVFVALLERWDPVTAAETAEAARLPVNQASSLLKRLEGRGAVEVVERKGRRKLYQAAERLYNIYYLMRRRGQPAGRVKAVVSFMVAFYEGLELKARVCEVAREGCALPPGARGDHYLAYTEAVRMTGPLARDIVVDTPPEFFKGSDAPSSVRGCVDVLVKDALRLSESGEYSDAEALCRQALERDPENALAWSELAWSLLRAGKELEEAEAAARSAVRAEPSTGFYWVVLSQVLFSAKRFAEAEEPARRATELRPGQHSAWGQLGIVLDNLGRAQEAEPALQKAVELGPKCPTAWFNLALWLDRSRRDEEAAKAYQRASELDPANSRTWNNLTWVLARLRRDDEAEQSLRKAVDLSSDRSDYWRGLGHLLLRLNRFEEAEKVWIEALDRHPRELAPCFIHLLELRGRRGVDAPELVAQAHEWIERTGRRPDVLAVLARFTAEELKPALKDAEAWASEAVSKSGDWKCAEALAFVLGAQDRWQEAIEASRPVLDAAAAEKEAPGSATALMIQAAAAGHAQAALAAVTGSKGAVALEPLAIGLRLFEGESPVVAQEILQIGQDVADRIREESTKRAEPRS